MIYVPQCQKYTSIFDRYCQIVNKESDAELQVSHQLSFGFQLRFGLHVGLCAEIWKSSIEYARSIGWWDYHLIDQVSDVQSIFFFHNFLQNSF